MRRVLVPHTDNGELGCGASIVRFVDEGADVFYAAIAGYHYVKRIRGFLKRGDHDQQS